MNTHISSLLIGLGLLIIAATVICMMVFYTERRISRQWKEALEPLAPRESPLVPDPGPPDRYVVGWDGLVTPEPKTMAEAWAEEEAVKGRRVDKDTVKLQSKLWQDFEAD